MENTVTIVGAGLVGTLCACVLAEKGYKVNVFEKREDIRTAEHFRGKSINLALSHRGLKALRLINLDVEILQYAIPMQGRCLHLSNGKTKKVLYDSVYKRCIYSVNRNFLNGSLLYRAEKSNNIQIRYKHKLKNVDFDKGICTFKNLLTDNEISFRSNLIIGADGAYSTVRSHMLQTPFFTYSQSFIDHGYVEFRIPSEFGKKHMAPNHLHIWPRKSFMLIALPNNDDSWTVTLFMPFEKLNQLNEPEDVVNFFESVFPDVIPLIGIDNLKRDFCNRDNNLMVTIKCSKLHYKKGLLIGDAAHAIVPFFGQGMNAGFEDCTILNDLLNVHKGDLNNILEAFTNERVQNVRTIANLANSHYLDMRDLSVNPLHMMRKTFDEFLFRLINKWIPLYVSVTFSDMSYTECVTNRERQDKILKWSLLFIIFIIFTLVFWHLRN